MTTFAYTFVLFLLICTHVKSVCNAFGPATKGEDWLDATARVISGAIAVACVLAGIYLPRPQ